MPAGNPYTPDASQPRTRNAIKFPRSASSSPASDGQKVTTRSSPNTNSYNAALPRSFLVSTSRIPAAHQHHTMVIALSDVIASNARLASRFPSGLVGLFIGGTSGVGEYTLKALAKHIPNSRLLVVGRSQEAADRIKKECLEYNTNCQFDFIKADLSSLKNVDDLCREIKSREKTINLLVQSQGSLGFEKKTADGFCLPSGVALYSRAHILSNLLPLLENASSHKRVVSVLCASFEGRIDISNIPAHGAGITNWGSHVASATDFLLEEAARQAPGVSFVHTNPGVVKSGIMRDTSGLLMGTINALMRVFGPLIETSPEETGERHLFFATDPRYAPRQNEDGTVQAEGVPAMGIDGQSGSGVYSVNDKGNDVSPKTIKLLKDMRADGTAAKVCEDIRGEIERIIGSDVGV